MYFIFPWKGSHSPIPLLPSLAMHITDRQVQASLSSIPSKYLLFHLYPLFCLFTLTWRVSSSPSHPFQPRDAYHWLTWWISPAPLPSMLSRDWLLFSRVWLDWRALWGPSARRRLCKIISTLTIIIYYFVPVKFLATILPRFRSHCLYDSQIINVVIVIIIIYIITVFNLSINYLFGITFPSPPRPKTACLSYSFILYIHLLFSCFLNLSPPYEWFYLTLSHIV